MKKEAAEVKKRKPVRRKQTLRVLYLQLLAVIGGVIGTVLHRMVLQYGMDEKELLIPNCPPYLALWIVLLGGLAGLAILSTKVGTESGYKANFPASIPAAAALVATGALFGVSSVMTLLEKSGDGIHKAGSILGLAAAAALVIWGVYRISGKKPAQWLGLAPCAYLVVLLIDHFRMWGRDPQIADYCFLLLSYVFAMLASFHLGGFALGEGYRRRSLFYAAGTVLLSVASLPTGDLVQTLHIVGLILWFLVGGPADLPKEKNPEL